MLILNFKARLSYITVQAFLIMWLHKKSAYRHMRNFPNNRPSNLFFPLLKIFLGSPEARASISRLILAALYKLLDAFFGIYPTP